MNTLPLNALRAFAVVVAEGGVRAAARELGVSHSAVSRHVSELEAWLGKPLLRRERISRGLVLTPDGERLAQAARAALQALERAVDGVRESRSTHTVTMSTTASVATRWLLPRLASLKRAHPRIELSVSVDAQLLDPAFAQIDFALRMGAGPWPEVSVEPLMDDALYPVMGRASWEAAGRPRAFAALLKLPLLHDRDPHAAWDSWRRAFGPAALDVRAGQRFASSDLVLRAAAQGLGVALARDRLVQDDLASGALVRPFGPHQVSVPDAYWIVTPLGAAPRGAAKTVIAWLRREALHAM